MYQALAPQSTSVCIPTVPVTALDHYVLWHGRALHAIGLYSYQVFSRAHAGYVTVQGIFFGLGQMQGLGLQHLHGMGFIMARLEAPDGLPVFSGPSYIEICSARAGVGAGISTNVSQTTCLSDNTVLVVSGMQSSQQRSKPLMAC